MNKREKLRKEILESYERYLENPVRDTEEYKKELNKIIDKY